MKDAHHFFIEGSTIFTTRFFGPLIYSKAVYHMKDAEHFSFIKGALIFTTMKNLFCNILSILFGIWPSINYFITSYPF